VAVGQSRGCVDAASRSRGARTAAEDVGEQNGPTGKLGREEVWMDGWLNGGVDVWASTGFGLGLGLGFGLECWRVNWSWCGESESGREHEQKRR